MTTQPTVITSMHHDDWANADRCALCGAIPQQSSPVPVRCIDRTSSLYRWTRRITADPKRMQLAGVTAAIASVALLIGLLLAFISLFPEHGIGGFLARYWFVFLFVVLLLSGLVRGRPAFQSVLLTLPLCGKHGQLAVGPDQSSRLQKVLKYVLIGYAIYVILGLIVIIFWDVDQARFPAVDFGDPALSFYITYFFLPMLVLALISFMYQVLQGARNLFVKPFGVVRSGQLIELWHCDPAFCEAVQPDGDA